MRKVMMVVAVLITSCHVSMLGNSQNDGAQSTTNRTHATKNGARLTTSADASAKRSKSFAFCSAIFRLLGALGRSSSRSDARGDFRHRPSYQDLRSMGQEGVRGKWYGRAVRCNHACTPRSTRSYPPWSAPSATQGDTHLECEGRPRNRARATYARSRERCTTPRDPDDGQGRARPCPQRPRGARRRDTCGRRTWSAASSASRALWRRHPTGAAADGRRRYTATPSSVGSESNASGPGRPRLGWPDAGSVRMVPLGGGARQPCDG